MSISKTHIYLMPGMAASPTIFNGIHLDENRFELHRLQWFLPHKGMTFQEYAIKMCEKVQHVNPVVLGVSFGGMLVQEMTKHIPVSKVIAVSCVKSKYELPKRMLFAKYTGAHKLLPTGLIHNVELLAKYAFGETVTKRLDLYEQYLEVRDTTYIDWAIHQIVHWNQEEPPENLIHVHGDKDAVFPITNIKNCITVKNGTHTMIVHRAKWFNEHLPRLILNRHEQF